MVKQYNVTVNGVSYEVTVESVGGGRGGYSHPAPVSAPAARPAPAPVAAAPAPAPAPAPDPAPVPDPNGAKLDTLIALFQQQQLGAQQPRQMTADEILADIIAPRPPKTDDK